MDILAFSIVAGNIKKEIRNRCGLNFSQTRILLYFAKNNNQALKMGDLANNLKISLSTLSRQLQQVKTIQLITITRSENDSSKTVVLSEKGLNKLKELKRSMNDIEKSLLQDLSQQEVNCLSQTFDKLIKKERLILSK
ncbi:MULTISPECIES: MarR family winged helix-turn-helix transcriptional regulator [unclassified Lactobacillus]|uniref:MarR family winged helix-turn-helix transcriptional regulator n=1 Tax=unclassified Lactobacillus TaxID=2620435 RepID=UPI000EFD3AE7|nr:MULTISPECIES: MarR family transcriptional regulator [unclassified Lactobacillus]RMC24621.1 MarR family transcriptional regulator [Lactobacillus sp. ESL0247]RMC28893.1 MarR family transcriptional regulator [Lactobacillus sp. ESL0246]RMC32138.1 MarR family transcriptional regulator [Lactobacillus sp. ESL0245]